MLSCVGRPLIDRYYGFCQLKTQMITPHYISNVLHDQIEQNTPRDFNDDLTSNEPQTCSKTCYQLVVLINFFPAKFSCCCCAGITSFLRFDFGMHAITLCFYDQHCAGESPAPLPLRLLSIFARFVPFIPFVVHPPTVQSRPPRALSEGSPTTESCENAREPR